MNKKNQGDTKTQHSNIYNHEKQLNPMVTLDNPDDRMTNQTGSGITLVEHDNPDDLEDKLTDEKDS